MVQTGAIVQTGYVALLDILGFSALMSGERYERRIGDYLNCLAH
jgi:hypothetical protein